MHPGERQTHTRSFPWWSHFTHPGPNSRFATNMCLFKLFSVSGQVLRADSGDLHGISFIPCSCWYFSWKSLKTLPSTLPTSNPSCGSDTWMTPFVVWPHGRDTLQDFLHPQPATPEHQVHHGNRRRPQDRVPWCWHFKKPRRLPTPQRLQKAHAHRSVPEPALLPSSKHQVIG